MTFHEFPLRAAMWSLVLHALVLVVFVSEFAIRADTKPPPSALHVVLRPSHRIDEAPGPVLQYPQPSPLALPVPDEKPTRRAAVESGRESPRAASFADVPRAPVASALRVPEPDEEGLDAAGLRQFRLSLAREARRFRRYPEAAERAGWSGTVEIRIAMEADGLGRRADLSRSSGHALLDAAALEMLQQALIHAVLPESLRGQAFAMLLPVVFEVTTDSAAAPP